MKSVLIIVFVFVCASLMAEADIQVSYTGFSVEQQAAYEHAISIWEQILNSSVPIKINATVQAVPNLVVITLPNLIRNFPDAPVQNVWYSTALANAIHGMELNTGEADVDIIINPNYPWYYGLDGACPASSIDFVTAALQTISYGLGYQSSFYVQQGYGSYGMLDPSVLGLSTSFPWEPMQNMPVIYDTFICNAQGQYLTDTTIFANPSPALNTQITGGNLSYHGTQGMNYNGDLEPVLYAGAFNLARTARLWSGEYEDTENAPGIPSAYNGLALHYPAPIVLGMLEDQGWSLDLSDLLLDPTDLLGDVMGSDVILGWTPPATPYDIHHYIICRDGAEVGTSLSNTFLDVDLPSGFYYYTVEAVYSMGVSDAGTGINVEVAVANEDDTQVPVAAISLKLFPNPLQNAGTMELKLQEHATVRFELYNLKGRKLGEYDAGQLSAGVHQLDWDIRRYHLGSLADGVYFVKCHAGSTTTIARILLMK